MNKGQNKYGIPLYMKKTYSKLEYVWIPGHRCTSSSSVWELLEELLTTPTAIYNLDNLERKKIQEAIDSAIEDWEENNS
jgi:hypothetical protein